MRLLYDAKNSCGRIWHPNAVGLTLREQSLAEFASRFEAETTKHIAEDDLVPTLWIDWKIDGKEALSQFFLQQLQ